MSQEEWRKLLELPEDEAFLRFIERAQEWLPLEDLEDLQEEDD